MKIILKIKRYNPETDEKPAFREYEVEVSPNQRLLDAMMHIKRNMDGSLGFRKSCAHGVCGSDAMRINGKDGLACKTLIKDLVEKEGETVVIEPLRHLPVQRDLIVDQTIFFKNYRAVKPYLINHEPHSGKERLQSPEDRRRFDDATHCILCAACYSACPILEDNPDFLGPAALAQAFRFIADSRDRGFEERRPALDHENGVWACQNHFQCTRACPRSIKLTKRINETKQKLNGAKKKGYDTA